MLWLATFLPSLLTSAFAQGEPLLTIDEDCPVFAFAPDGRIAYAVRRIVTVRKIEMQRDDIWVTSLDGKKKRIVNGERLFPSAAPVGYAIHSIAWSPDSTRLAVEMIVRQMVSEDGETKEEAATLLFEDTGKEYKIQGGGNAVLEASHAVWLGDGVTLAYLTETAKPGLLFAMNTLRPIAGRGARLFERSTFAAVAWDPRHQAAAAIERDASLSGPPRLVWLDLQKQTRRDLGELSGYIGSLTVSPSGEKVACFTDRETLEIRRLSEPEKVVRVRVALGPYQWALDESRILIKRGVGRRSSDLMWVRLPANQNGGPQDAQVEPVLHSLTFWDFELSPDGRHLAVTSPGKRKINVYALP